MKSVEIVVPDGTKFVPKRIDDMLRTIKKKAVTVEDRHVPAVSEVEEGMRCSFLDSLDDLPGSGVVFRFGSYRMGHLPLGLKPDFSQPSVDVAAGKLVDTKTNGRREPASVLWGVAFGQVIVMESLRGPGGVGALEKCLWELIRQFVDPRYPRIHLVDVQTKESAASIDRAGGIKEVLMDVVRKHQDSEHAFGELLSEAISQIGGTDVVRLHYKANGDHVLKKSDTLKAYEALDADELDKLILVLKDGSKIVGTDQFRVRKHVGLDADSTGKINDGDLIREMVQFLVELQKKHDGRNIVTNDGILA